MQPNGPYLLCGDCSGGEIAFEIAQQLNDLDQKIGLVAIIDAYLAGSIHLPKPKQKFNYHMNLLRELNTRGKLKYLLNLSKNRGIRMARKLSQQAVDHPLHMFAEQAYIPRHYPGKITLIRPLEQLDGFYYDLLMGWGGMADSIEAYDIPGNGQTIYQEPNVQALAEQLQHCMDDFISSM